MPYFIDSLTPKGLLKYITTSRECVFFIIEYNFLIDANVMRIGFTINRTYWETLFYRSDRYGEEDRTQSSLQTSTTSQRRHGTYRCREVDGGVLARRGYPPT